MIVFGLLVRLAVVVAVPTQPVSDFWEYFLRAESLIEAGSYDPFPETPDANHPPAYPLLLGLGMLLAPGLDRLIAAKLVNCGLGALTIGIGARLTRDLWGERAGLIAALWFAFYPRYLLMPCLLASENLFAPLLVLFLAIAARAWRAPKALSAAATAGTVVGLLALTRTVAYALGLVWLAGSLANGRRWRTVLAEIVLLLAVQHAVMLPWAIRNEREIDRFTFLSTTGGIGLFIGNNSNATGDWYDWRADLERARPGTLSKSPVELDEAAREIALDWMRRHPWQAARLYLQKLRIMLVQDTLVADWTIYQERVSPPEPGVPVLPGPHPLKRHRMLVLSTLRISAALLLLFALGGGLVLLRKALRSRSRLDWAVPLTFFAAAAYIPLLSALIAVNGRYRWPVEDLLVPLASLFLGYIAESAHRRRARLQTVRSFERSNLTLPTPTSPSEGGVDHQLYAPPRDQWR